MLLHFGSSSAVSCSSSSYDHSSSSSVHSSSSSISRCSSSHNSLASGSGSCFGTSTLDYGRSPPVGEGACGFHFSEVLKPELLLTGASLDLIPDLVVSSSVVHVVETKELTELVGSLSVLLGVVFDPHVGGVRKSDSSHDSGGSLLDKALFHNSSSDDVSSSMDSSPPGFESS